MAHSVAIIGAPTSLGGLPLGTDKGPAALRAAGLPARLHAAGQLVTDLGDVPVSNRRVQVRTTTQLQRIASMARWVEKHCWRALAEGMTPLVLGGDHSFAMGSIAASAQRVPSLGVVWIDAHPDFHTPETSTSGNVHGMALAVVAGLGDERLLHLSGFTPMVHPERIVVIGARSIDAGEARNLREAGVRVYENDDVERNGVRATVIDALAYLEGNGVRAVHLSVDLDVLDPSIFPGVSTPVAGGFAASDLILASRLVGKTLPIAAMDIAEYTPPEDVGGKTAEVAVLVAEAAMSAVVPTNEMASLAS